MAIKKAGTIGKYTDHNNIDFYLCVIGNEAGKLGFPKGHLEINEKPIECAQRECYEETGIKVQLTGDIAYGNNQTVYYSHRFESMPKPNPQDLVEVREVKWISLLELLGTNFNMFNTDLKKYVKNFLIDNDGFITIVNNKKPKPMKKQCAFFIRGDCKKGSICDYRH